MTLCGCATHAIDFIHDQKTNKVAQACVKLVEEHNLKDTVRIYECIWYGMDGTIIIKNKILEKHNMIINETQEAKSFNYQ